MASPVSSDQSVDPRVTRSRAAILSAAADELVDRGFASFTMDGVVARSGVAKTTVYRHWCSKGDLLHDVIQSFKQFPPVPDTGRLRDDLILIVGGLIEALWRFTDPYLRALPSLVEAAERDGELAALHARITAERSDRVRQVLERGKETAELRPDIDVELAISMLVGPPFQRRFIMRRPIPPAETEPFIDAVLTGLAAEPSRGHRRSAPVGRRRS
jgi:AcrR family transcriptional regulator